MLIRDRIQFRFPRDRELIFPAAAVLQDYVNGYNQRMAANDMGQGNKYMLHYAIDIAKEDWELLQRVGLQLLQNREVLNGYDMLVDLSEERLAMYRNSGKHVCQAYAVMSGVGSILPIPRIRTVLPNKKEQVWGVIVHDSFALSGDLFRDITADDLVELSDEKLTGVIGYASWQTYLAASYGLPVIELIPEERPLTWLSKWSNPLYRAVHGIANESLKQISSAMENIWEVLHGVPEQVDV